MPGHAHRRIIRVPGARRQAHQRAERAADQRGGEQAGGGHAVAAAARVKHRPPEERASSAKKQACWAMCQPKLSSARSNRAGACHAHMTTRLDEGRGDGLGKLPPQPLSGDFQLPPSHRRSGRGRPQARTPPALDAASSKVATSMISSCSIMCMVKLRSPASCSGEISDSVSTAQPARKRAGRTGVEARVDSRRQPTR